MMMDEKTTKSKIYKRATLHTISVKTKKEESRKRNVILNFRVSEKEKELIEKRIELSGLKKSEFFIQSCLYQAILVKGNVHAFDKSSECLKDIGTEISKVESLSKIDIETLLELRTIIELLKFVYR